ncbi:MAG: SWF/SNF helicase family protein, partial [Myxococcales bacterium]|nr:SWF/SNF helicase family protein [Myxococcales bacterium]
RIERYHGGMSDERRNELKHAFNTDPRANPVRVLLATDAAREGINLQAHCTDLFHFDLPWNPARIEQRNGRIDRTLQPAAEVRCHYFYIPDRPEDRVLTYVVKKMAVISEELGSLTATVSSKLAERMEQGIRDLGESDVDQVLSPPDSALEAAKVLEAEGAEELRGDLDRLERRLESSKRRLGYDPDHLKEAVDLGLHLACGDGLQSNEPLTDPPSWVLPGALDGTWEGVLSAIREPRTDHTPIWQRPPLRPVSVRAQHLLGAEVVQLHLGHPLVKRLLSRFRSQGFSAHDLSRATLVYDADSSTRRVLAFGRLLMYGRKASRLHEQIVAVGARWRGDEPLEPYTAETTEKALERLYDCLGQAPKPHHDAAARDLALRNARSDFDALWAPLKQEAANATEKALAELATRATQESDAMVALLERQRRAIQEQMAKGEQYRLELAITDKRESEQFERDRISMEKRLWELDSEVVVEPQRIAKTYQVELTRFEPVGLVYLWP